MVLKELLNLKNLLEIFNMKKYYLAYGSNLNIFQMKFRCKKSVLVGTTILKDYRLVYKGIKDEFAYLTIEPSKGDYVPLGIYKISFFDEIELNKYEGYPYLYHKENMNVTICDKEEKALIYIMNDNFEYCLPAQDYVDICIRGYKDFNFDKNLLIQALEHSDKSKCLIK